MSLIDSLRSLPPKQALILALAEKARLRKLREEREAAERTRQHALDEASIRPEFKEVPSLVLNRNHPLSDLYYKKARYKVYWGGRGSAKSWGFAEALVRLAAAAPIRVLCVREYQNSIKDSSHKILKDTIARLGMQSWFNVTAEGITSRAGAEFMFKGLHNNTNGIRSTEGIDICWAEEAHSISAGSWRVLLPTIRKEESEIWISFNMEEEDDATYKMFVGGEPEIGGTLCPAVRPGSIVHKVNYDSNPYFPATLREEMETDKANDYELYEHIWLGMPLKISDEIIFSGKYAEKDFPDDLWKQADGGRRFRGLDWGYAQDPMACISFFPLTEIENGKRVKNLYIEYEAYGTGVEITEYDEFLDAIPDKKMWPIKSDAARPEFASNLRGLGYPCSAAEKWEGSVKDGITFLRGFHKIYIHPRCRNMLREARLYRYKVDKKTLDDKGRPLVLPIIIDKHNHGWDAIRYGFDGHVVRSGDLGIWAELGKAADAQAPMPH